MKKKQGKVNRRKAVGLLSSGVAGVALGANLVGGNPSTARAEQTGGKKRKKPAAKRKGIYPETVKAADAFYSPAILARGRQFLFISGQGPRDLKADPETQIRQTFENIQTVLETAGASWKNVVMIRSFFKNMKRDLPLFRKVRQEFLVKPYPASTVVGTTELAVAGLEIEFEAVAVL